MMFIVLKSPLFSSVRGIDGCRTFEILTEGDDNWISLNEGLDLNVYFDDIEHDWKAVVYPCIDQKTNTDCVVCRPKVHEWWVPPTRNEKAVQALRTREHDVLWGENEVRVKAGDDYFRLSEAEIQFWVDKYDEFKSQGILF